MITTTENPAEDTGAIHATTDAYLGDHIDRDPANDTGSTGATATTEARSYRAGGVRVGWACPSARTRLMCSSVISVVNRLNSITNSNCSSV
jgi:hypothetical protein